MTHFYEKHDRILVALDCIIFGFDRKELKLLLIKRDFEPEQGKWSLMGGFLNKNESLDKAASDILRELTGLRNIYLEQMHTYGAIDRDPVERTISVAYYALIDIHKHDKELVKKYGAQWFPISEVPSLIFDHNEMVQNALRSLRMKASFQPVGFELLPDRFTLPDLQQLYEAIYNTPMDKRNFRRRVLAMDILENTGLKQKNNSKKGAFLYQFDEDKYKEKLAEGDNFKFNASFP